MTIFEVNIVPNLMRIWPCLAAGTVTLDGELRVAENCLETLVYLAMDERVMPMMRSAVGVEIFIKHERESTSRSLTMSCRKILAAFGETSHFGMMAIGD
jgi:hypothetical protein